MAAKVIAFPVDRAAERALLDFAQRRIEFDCLAITGSLSDTETVTQDAVLRLEAHRLGKRRPQPITGKTNRQRGPVAQIPRAMTTKEQALIGHVLDRLEFERGIRQGGLTSTEIVSQEAKLTANLFQLAEQHSL